MTDNELNIKLNSSASFEKSPVFISDSKWNILLYNSCFSELFKALPLRQNANYIELLSDIDKVKIPDIDLNAESQTFSFELKNYWQLSTAFKYDNDILVISYLFDFLKNINLCRVGRFLSIKCCHIYLGLI